MGMAGSAFHMKPAFSCMHAAILVFCSLIKFIYCAKSKLYDQRYSCDTIFFYLQFSITLRADTMDKVHVELAFLETSLTNSFFLAKRTGKGPQQEYDDFKIALNELYKFVTRCASDAYSKGRQKKGTKKALAKRPAKSSAKPTRSKRPMQPKTVPKKK